MINKEKVLKEAKKIMDNFSEALEEVEGKDIEIGAEAEPALRDGSSAEGEADFAERLLENAPRKKGRYLVAEKKSW